MTFEIIDGWLFGSLPDDTGKEWPIERHPQAASGSQNGSPVNLVLHTTETDHLVGTLQFPSNFQCGDGKIVQHIKLGESGDAVWTYDRDNIGIEMVGRSKTGLWLPGESTLGPCVALVAWLHASNRIKTGIARPYDYPDLLDRMPAAVTTYYRRHDPRDKAGVYGHVDLNGGNSHWDPGSFNYTKFFNRVKAVLNGDEMTDAEKKQLNQAFNLAKAIVEALGANTFDGAGNRVGKAVKKVETAPAPVPSGHTHDDVTVSGPAKPV